MISLDDSSNDVYLALRGEWDEDQKDEGVGQDEESVKAGGYMTLSQTQGGQTQGGQTQTGQGGRLVDASIQKNISFDGKPITNWNGGPSEVFSLRDQLRLAEERASQVQRQVWTQTLLTHPHTSLIKQSTPM